MTPVSTLGKRAFEYSSTGRRGRPRHNQSPIIPQISFAAQRVLSIQHLNSTQEISKNQIFLSTIDALGMFIQLSNRYVEIAQRIYKVSILNWLEEGTIGINSVQYDDMVENTFQQDGKAMIQVSEFPGINGLTKAHSISLKICNFSEGGGQFFILLSKLEELCKTVCKELVLGRLQRLLLNTEVGMLELEVTSIAGEVQDIIRAIVKADTQFKIDGNGKIVLVEKIVEDEIKSLEFEIKYIHSINEIHPHFPIVVDNNELMDKIRKKILGTAMVVGHKVDIIDSTGRRFSARLTAGFVNSQDAGSEKRVYGFKAGQNTEFLLTQKNGEISFVADKSLSATNIEFRIIGHSGSPVDIHKTLQRRPWISVEKLEEAVRGRSLPLILGQKLSLNLDSGEFIAEVVAVKGGEQRVPGVLEKVKKPHTIEATTVIKWHMDYRCQLKLIDHENVIPLKKLVVEVSSEEGGQPLMMLFKQMEKNIIEVRQEELEEIFRENLPAQFTLDQRNELTLKNGRLIKTKVQLTQFEKKQGVVPVHALLGQLTSDTVIEFVAEEQSEISILPKSHTIDVKDLVKELADRGVGGLGKQLEEIRKHILLSRGTLREYAKSIGLQPERGILLYGPPGTGKTALARAIAELLGGKGVKVKHVIATELLKKYVGESEGLVRELIKEALDDQNKHGEKSAQHVIIIDEIDAILLKRSEHHHSWVNSLVNQFLGILDGDKKEPKLENVLFIGMTNKKEHLEPAALRQGRFGLHLEIGIPTDEARKEILQIHLRPLMREGAIGKLDIDAIVNETEGWTGADMKGLVSRAATFSLERFADLNATVEEWMTHPDRTVTQKDFEKAIKGLRAILGEKEMSIELKLFYGII